MLVSNLVIGSTPPLCVSSSFLVAVHTKNLPSRVDICQVLLAEHAVVCSGTIEMQLVSINHEAFGGDSLFHNKLYNTLIGGHTLSAQFKHTDL